MRRALSVCALVVMVFNIALVTANMPIRNATACGVQSNRREEFMTKPFKILHNALSVIVWWQKAIQAMIWNLISPAAAIVLARPAPPWSIWVDRISTRRNAPIVKRPLGLIWDTKFVRDFFYMWRMAMTALVLLWLQNYHRLALWRTVGFSSGEIVAMFIQWCGYLKFMMRVYLELNAIEKQHISCTWGQLQRGTYY